MKSKALFFNTYDEEKYRVILQTLVDKGPVTKTVLMYGAEVSTERFQRLHLDLLEKGMIRHTDQISSNRFQYPLIEITPIGRKLLTKYSELAALIDWTITGTGRN